MPPTIVAFWLLLRFSRPKQGVRSAKVMSVPGGRSFAAWWIFLLLLLMLRVGLELAGVQEDMIDSIQFWLFLAAVLPALFAVVKVVKSATVAERRGAETANAEWQRGELELAGAGMESSVSE